MTRGLFIIVIYKYIDAGAIKISKTSIVRFNNGIKT